MTNWLKRLFGGSGSSTTEAPEPETAPEPPSMPAEPPTAPVGPIEPTATDEGVSEPAGDEPA